MPKGIELGISSETKGFKQGIDSGVIAPLDDAVDALKKLGDTGDKTGDSLEKSLKDSQRATKDNAQEYRDLAAQMSRTARSGSNDFEISSREQTHLRKEAIKEIGNEAKANAAETFSSFNGSAESFADGIQGTLGGLVSSLGPVGLAAGAAGALGIGFISGAITNANELSDEFKQSVADMTTELIESGQVGKVSVGYITDQLKKLAVESDASKVSLDKIFDAAKRSNNSSKDLALAYAGQEAGLKKLLATAREKLLVDTRVADAAAAAVTNSDDVTSANSRSASELYLLASAQKQYTGYLEDAAKKAKDAKRQQQEYADAGGPELQRKADLVKQIDSAYDDAAGAVDDYIDKESGLFDVTKYIAAMLAKKQALADYQADLAKSGLSPAAKTFLESEGADAAATLLHGYVTGSASQQAILANIWNEAGGASSGAYVKALKAGLPATVDGPVLLINPDIAAAQSVLDKWRPPVKTVQVDLVTRTGARVI